MLISTTEIKQNFLEVGSDSSPDTSKSNDVMLWSSDE